MFWELRCLRRWQKWKQATEDDTYRDLLPVSVASLVNSSVFRFCFIKIIHKRTFFKGLFCFRVTGMNTCHFLCCPISGGGHNEFALKRHLFHVLIKLKKVAVKKEGSLLTTIFFNNSEACLSFSFWQLSKGLKFEKLLLQILHWAHIKIHNRISSIQAVTQIWQ